MINRTVLSTCHITCFNIILITYICAEAKKSKAWWRYLRRQKLTRTGRYINDPQSRHQHSIAHDQTTSESSPLCDRDEKNKKPQTKIKPKPNPHCVIRSREARHPTNRNQTESGLSNTNVNLFVQQHLWFKSWWFLEDEKCAATCCCIGFSVWVWMCYTVWVNEV